MEQRCSEAPFCHPRVESTQWPKPEHRIPRRERTLNFLLQQLVVQAFNPSSIRGGVRTIGFLDDCSHGYSAGNEVRFTS
jgi:hypothetical protein